MTTDLFHVVNLYKLTEMKDNWIYLGNEPRVSHMPGEWPTTRPPVSSSLIWVNQCSFLKSYFYNLMCTIMELNTDHV